MGRHSREGGNPDIFHTKAVSYGKSLDSCFHRNDPSSITCKQKMKQFYVCILCSRRNGTLYTGVTSDLVKRVYEHKNDLVKGFTKKHGVHHLVWYETHEFVESAITREKQIKKWKRAWKLKLIEQNNPQWIDLYETICK